MQAERVKEITDLILNYTTEPVRVRVFGDDLYIDFTTRDLSIIHYDKHWPWEKIRRDIDQVLRPVDVCGICLERPDGESCTVGTFSGWMTCETCNQSHCVRCYIQSWTASNCATCPWCRATQGEPTSPVVTAAEQRDWLARTAK